MKGYFHFLCCEMKAPKGKLSKEQEIFKDQVFDDGGYYCMAEKALDVVLVIKSYLLIGA